MKKEARVETLLSIIELNKIKQKLFSDMTKLDYYQLTETEGYRKLIEYYELTCLCMNKKLLSLSEKEKIELQNIIVDITPDFARLLDFSSLLAREGQIIVLGRALMDFGAKFVSFQDQLALPKQNSMEFIFSCLGLSDHHQTSVLNSSLIDDYLVSDFVQTLFSTVQKMSQDSKYLVKKRELEELKYRLLFLLPVLESRALLTKFSIPDEPCLIDELRIRTAGMKEEEYIDTLDHIALDWLQNILAFRKPVQPNIAELALIKTLVTLHSYEEIGPYLLLEHPELTSEEFPEIVEILSSKNKSEDNQKLRKYPRI